MLHSLVVVQAAQGDESGAVQRARGDRCGRLQAHAMFDPGERMYEWQDTPDGKQPYYFTRRDGQPITIAGLWDAWRDKQRPDANTHYGTTPTRIRSGYSDTLLVRASHLSQVMNLSPSRS